MLITNRRIDGQHHAAGEPRACEVNHGIERSCAAISQDRPTNFGAAFDRVLFAGRRRFAATTRLRLTDISLRQDSAHLDVEPARCADVRADAREHLSTERKVAQFKLLARVVAQLGDIEINTHRRGECEAQRAALAADTRQPGRQDTPPPLLRRSGATEPLRDRLAPLAFADGLAEVPDGPGWGIVPDRDAARPHTVSTREVAA